MIHPIVFEGPDGVGKSGFAEWLADEIGWVFVPSPKQAMDACVEARASVRAEMLLNFARSNVSMVVDRGPLSSIVYSEVHNRDEPEHATQVLADLNPVIVHMTCDPAELEIRHEDDLQDDIAAIVNTYHDKIDEHSDSFRRVFEYDTTTGVLDELRNDVSYEAVMQ